MNFKPLKSLDLDTFGSDSNNMIMAKVDIYNLLSISLHKRIANYFDI